MSGLWGVRFWYAGWMKTNHIGMGEQTRRGFLGGAAIAAAGLGE